jgi:ABC-type uncharacterized transport system fused permease/ATPase subunit
MIKEAIRRIPTRKLVVLSTFLITVVVAEIALTSVIPMWRELFYNILQTKNIGGFNEALILFTLLMLSLGAVQGLKTWSGQLLSYQVRQTATKVMFKPWVKGSRKIKNYTQAMTEALRNSTELYLEVGVEVFISASIVIALIAANIHNTALLLAALAYTIGMSVLALVFNKPLISSDKNWQSEEGEFRETLSYLYSGENCFTFKDKLQQVTLAYYRYIKVAMIFTLFSRVKTNVASLIPYIMLSGAYFTGNMTLGQFMAGVSTFELIVINSTILLILYPKLMKARASHIISSQFYKEVIEEGKDK